MLIGREEEEGRFRLLLQESTVRWISVLGLGGVGKSRFVAHLLQDEGACIFVSLGEELGARDDRLASSIIRHAQVCDPENASSPERTLARTKFLVVENGELLRDEERGELKNWLNVYRGLRVVVTSRVSAHPSEHAFFLESLRTRGRAGEDVREVAAVRLLEATLKTQCAETFDPSLLAEIADEVGGLPLALVVLAPTIASFGAPQTLARLRAGGQSFVQETSASIHALAFAWEDAPAPVVEALRALSAFDGAFSGELAAVLVPDETHLRLRALRERSLIEVDHHERGVRYRLHPIVRNYVRQLVPAVVAACTETLDEHLLERSTRCWFVAPFTPSVEWVAAEYGSIYSALMRVQASTESSAERLAQAGLAALCLQHTGVPIDESAELALRLSDPAVLRAFGDRGDCLLSRFIGMKLSWVGDPDGSKWHERSQKCAQGLDVDEGQVELSFTTLEQQCHRLLEDKDVEGAKEVVEKMRLLLPRLGTPRSLSSVKAMDALSQRGDAEPDWVLGRLLESRRLIAATNPYHRTWLSARLADMALDAGRTTESLAYAQEAMESLSVEHPLHTYCTQLAVMSCLDDPEQVRGFLEPAEERLRESEDQGQRWTLALARLMVILHRRDWSEAVTQTELLLLTAPAGDPESKLALGIGLAIVSRLETPLGSASASSLDILNLPASKSSLFEAFRTATVAWLDGAPAQDVFTFPIRPTATPLETAVVRQFIAGPLEVDTRDVLELGLDWAWAILPGGERLALSAKPAMRRLLRALIEGHEAGVSLTTDELFERGWPNETIRADSARNRVRVALSRLRKAGFSEMLERTPDGMRLRPSLQIVVT